MPDAPGPPGFTSRTPKPLRSWEAAPLMRLSARVIVGPSGRVWSSGTSTVAHWTVDADTVRGQEPQPTPSRGPAVCAQDPPVRPATSIVTLVVTPRIRFPRPLPLLLGREM